MKSSDDELPQLDLGLLPGRLMGAPGLVSLDSLRRIKTLRKAYSECIEEAISRGLVASAGEVASYIQIDEAQLNRVMNGGGRNLDDDKLNLLERVCGNKIPSQWLALQDGFELRPLESELERENRELKERLERMTLEQEGIIRFLRKTRIGGDG
jgi:plasmid maintenance system antidote protein VapI